MARVWHVSMLLSFTMPLLIIPLLTLPYECACPDGAVLQAVDVIWGGFERHANADVQKPIGLPALAQSC